MRRVLLFSYFCVTATLLVGKPKLHLPKRIITLDTLYMSQKEVKLSVPIVNTGDSPLYITSTKVFCPCMKISHSEEGVMPGDTATIDVTYSFIHTENFSNTVRIYYNTENPEEFEKFTLYGYIKEEDD